MVKYWTRNKLCIIMHYPEELHTLLTSVPDEGERLALCPGHLTTGERIPSTYRRAGLVGFRAVLDAFEKRKIPGIEP
jgi:hypothetical protein